MQLMQQNEINLKPPLVWAYIGDAVYELYVRTNLAKSTNVNAHKLHKEAIKYVSAKAQAKKLMEIKEKLTEEELDIVRRARNTQNHHTPKNTELSEYMYSTAFEALIGYLYLTEQKERLEEILELSM